MKWKKIERREDGHQCQKKTDIKSTDREPGQAAYG
jgi:hypothetical protein